MPVPSFQAADAVLWCEWTAFTFLFDLDYLFAVLNYVLMEPTDNESVLDDNKTAWLVYLSALFVAVRECQFKLPLFVLIGRPPPLLYHNRHHQHRQQHHHELVRYKCDCTHQQSDYYRHVADLLSFFLSLFVVISLFSWSFLIVAASAKYFMIFLFLGVFRCWTSFCCLRTM